MKPLSGRLLIYIAIAATLLGALWVWRCYCVFPWLPWNELRLEPSFLLLDGSLYPPAGDGPVTTWIYGPITPVLLLPSVLATSAAGALLIGGAINGVLVLGTIVGACALWPVGAESPAGGRERVAAALACLAVWPASSLEYIQADNAAVAFGVASNLLLVAPRLDLNRRLWLAALAAVVAIACKQTALSVLAAQLAWLAAAQSGSTALRYFWRVALLGALVAVAAIARFGFEGLWLNLIEVPRRLPWAQAPAERLWQLAPWLLVHLGAPALVLVVARRALFARGSPLALATFSWLAALPFGLAALLKIGGTINSLHGLLYFLPPCVLAALGFSRRERAPFSTMLAAAAVLGIRLVTTSHPGWKPVTEHLRQADAIATQLPGEVWFPWNPLVTFFREHRFDHVEDGLYARAVSGHALSAQELRAHLPPRWSVTALLTHGTDWHLALELSPPDHAVSTLGSWTLHSWNTPAAPR